MYRANPGTVEAQTRDWLKGEADNGRIEIGLSYHLIFELLQKAEPKYRHDRMARARLLTELCGRNCFPYPTDLGRGYTFSNDGLWVPRIDIEDLEIERVVEQVMEGIPRLPGINRHERRILSKRNYFREWFRSNPSGAAARVLEVWPLRFGHAFVENGDFARYLSGRMSRAEANTNIWFYITDPATVYGIWFEDYGRGDPIAERRDRLVDGLMEMLESLRKMLDGSVQLERNIKDAFAGKGGELLTPEEHEALVKLSSDVTTFKAELNSPNDLYERVPKWRELFGDDSALIAAQILYAYLCEKRPIKRSDGIDFVHAMYLPHTNLWRGDRAFSDLLIKHRVKFSDRIISALSDVPTRVEAEFQKYVSDHT
jgi:hypothetical protein